MSQLRRGLGGRLLTVLACGVALVGMLYSPSATAGERDAQESKLKAYSKSRSRSPRGSNSARAARREREKQQAAAAAKRADELFAKGTRAFEQGQYPQALKSLEKAHEIYPTYRSAAALGQVELHLGRYRDAAEHLDYSLRTFPGSTDSATFQRVLDGLSEARRHVHIINLQSALRGAEVRIDGELVAVTPVGHDLFVDPGNREIVVNRPGYDAYTLEAFLPAGGSRKLTAELTKQTRDEPQVLSERARDTVREEPDAELAPVVLAVGSMTTLAALGTGVALWLSADSAQQEAQDQRQHLAQSGVDCGSESADCRPIREALDRAQTRGDLATVAFVGAAATGLLSVGLYSLFSISEASDKQRLRVGAVATPDASWLSLHGSF